MIPGPLEGVRILDLTRVWAGPLAGMIVADLGAEVIKVEGPDTRGPGRVPKGPHGSWPDGDPGDTPWNRSGTINNLTRNRRSICLDLKSEAGRDLFRRLAMVSDVVLENFAAAVMDRLGIGSAELRAANPRLVYVAMPGFGGNGPYRDYVSYGPALEPAAGLPALMGYGDVPHGSGTAIPDPVGGSHAAAAVSYALERRRRTGTGSHVDLSQQEATISIIGEYAVEAQLIAGEPERSGNGHPHYSLQGTYPCRGEDRWIVISCRDESEWEALADHAGLGWGSRWTSAEQRRSDPDLAEAIGAWTAPCDARELMGRLQGAGIPAAMVARNDDLLADEQLRARRYFVELDDHDGGPHLYAGTPTRIDGARHEGFAPAPTLGGDNRWVLRNLLDLGEDEIDGYERAGVIADRPTDADTGGSD